VSAADTKLLIGSAAERLMAEVPSFAQLKLVIRLQLQAKGGDAPIWRVEVPGPKIDRDPAGDARIDVTVQRQQFNELAKEGGLREWARAYERGHVKVTGDSAVVKLLANVVDRQLSRARS
jgi:hypothetical protein